MLGTSRLRRKSRSSRSTARSARPRSEEHTSELLSQSNIVCRLLLEKKENPRSPVIYQTSPALALSSPYSSQAAQRAAPGADYIAVSRLYATGAEPSLQTFTYDSICQ